MIVCDTGPLVAAFNAKDRHHRRSVDVLETHRGPLLVPSPILTEVCYLLASRSGPRAEAAFLRALCSGELELVSLVAQDLERMSELVEKYGDLPLGAADASVVAVAERLGSVAVATIDVKHFRIVQPRHVPAFTLLPAGLFST